MGVGGTSPQSKAQRIVWWIIFAIFGLFIAFVLIKNRHNF
jgi:hypothetical protein